MSEFHETYVTKKNPTVDDWLDYQDELFTKLKAGESMAGVHNAPLVNFDQHAERAGVGVHEYFGQLEKQVGSLGRGALHLIDVEMDDSYHVVVGPKEMSEG